MKTKKPITETTKIKDESKHIVFSGTWDLLNSTLLPFSSDRAFGMKLSDKDDFTIYMQEMCAKYMDANRRSKSLEADLSENGFHDSKGGRPTFIPFWMYFFAKYDIFEKVFYERMWNAKNKETQKRNRKVAILKLVKNCVDVYNNDGLTPEEKIEQVKILSLKKRLDKNKFYLNERGLYVLKEDVINVNIDDLDMVSVPVSGITRYCVCYTHGLDGDIAFTKEAFDKNPFGSKVVSIFNDATIPFEERCELLDTYIEFLYPYYNFGTAKSANQNIIKEQMSTMLIKLLKLTEYSEFGINIGEHWAEKNLFMKLRLIIQEWFDNRKSYISVLNGKLADVIQSTVELNCCKAGIGKEQSNALANAFSTLLMNGSKRIEESKEEIAREIGIDPISFDVVDLPLTQKVAQYFADMKTTNGGDVSYIKTDMISNYLSNGKTVSDYVALGIHLVNKTSYDKALKVCSQLSPDEQRNLILQLTSVLEEKEGE